MLNRLIVVCTENGPLIRLYHEKKMHCACIDFEPSTELENFRSKTRNGVNTQSMPRPLRGSTHTLKQGHHNHVAVACVWLLLGATSQAQAALFALKILSQFGGEAECVFRAFGIQTPTGHFQCK